MHKTDRTWLSRIGIACILVTLAATPAWADDERPVVDDSQFGKDKPAPSTRPRLFLVGDSTVKSGDGPHTGWGEVLR